MDTIEQKIEESGINSQGRAYKDAFKKPRKKEATLRGVQKHGGTSAFLFVHGFAGTVEDIWRENLPEIGETFPKRDVYAYGYSTGIGPGKPGLQALSDDLVKTTEKLIDSGYKEIIFGGHSLGGLLIRRARLDSEKIRDHFGGMVLCATPNNGLKVPILSSVHAQVKEMHPNSPFMQKLNNDEAQSNIGNGAFVRTIEGLKDSNVPVASSRGMFPEDTHIKVDRGHKDSARGARRPDDVARIIKDALSKSEITDVAREVTDRVISDTFERASTRSTGLASSPTQAARLETPKGTPIYDRMMEQKYGVKRPEGMHPFTSRSSAPEPRKSVMGTNAGITQQRGTYRRLSSVDSQAGRELISPDLQGVLFGIVYKGPGENGIEIERLHLPQGDGGPNGPNYLCIHGYGDGRFACGFVNSDGEKKPVSIFGRSPKFLKELPPGKAFAVHYPTASKGCDDLTTVASKIEKALEEPYFKDKRLNIFGYSVGGLVAKKLATSQGVQGKIDRLIHMATPEKGLRKYISRIAGTPDDQLRDTKAGSDFQNKLREEFPQKTPFYTANIAMKRDFFVSRDSACGIDSGEKFTFDNGAFNCFRLPDGKHRTLMGGPLKTFIVGGKEFGRGGGSEAFGKFFKGILQGSQRQVYIRRSSQDKTATVRASTPTRG